MTSIRLQIELSIDDRSDRMAMLNDGSGRVSLQKRDHGGADAHLQSWYG